MKSKVRMGNKNQVEVDGLGIIIVASKLGKKIIHDVMYMPGLAQNLPSLLQLIRCESL